MIMEMETKKKGGETGTLKRCVEGRTIDDNEGGMDGEKDEEK